MPMRALRGCSISGCANLVEKAGDRYCKDHKKIYNKNYDKFERKYEHDERYDSRWKKVREIYIKSHMFCEECMKNGKLVKASLVHHKIPIEFGGEKYDFENLMSLCQSCHQKIHRQLGHRY